MKKLVLIATTTALFASLASASFAGRVALQPSCKLTSKDLYTCSGNFTAIPDGQCVRTADKVEIRLINPSRNCAQTANNLISLYLRNRSAAGIDPVMVSRFYSLFASGSLGTSMSTPSFGGASQQGCVRISYTPMGRVCPLLPVDTDYGHFPLLPVDNDYGF